MADRAERREIHRLGACAGSVPGARLPDGPFRSAGRPAGPFARQPATRAQIPVARDDPSVSREPERVPGRRLSRLSRTFRGAGAPANGGGLVSETFEISDIQGNILRGYRRGMARNLVLEVTDRKAARRFLAASVAG